MLAPLVLLVLAVLLDEGAAHAQVVIAVEQHGLRRRAVAARAADLLVVSLHAGRQVEMADIADVRLVDAHAEGDGRHHHRLVLAHEAVLAALAQLRILAGMIGDGVEPFLLQESRDLVGELARQAIDDARLALLVGEERQQLLRPMGLVRDAEAQVRPVEAVDDDAAVASEQLLRDVRARRLVGGRGEGGDVRRREQFLQPGQLLIFRPEARAPFGDAMRLVHHEQMGVEPVQRAQHVLVHQPLGREIEQLGLARRRLAPFRDLLVPPHAGVDRGRLDAIGAQAGDLIVHQRLQRRNDDGRPLQQQCRDLVAQRLARPGRHHRQHALAAEDEIDDLLLPGAEGCVAEDVVEDLGGTRSCARDYPKPRSEVIMHTKPVIPGERSETPGPHADAPAQRRCRIGPGSRSFAAWPG